MEMYTDIFTNIFHGLLFITTPGPMVFGLPVFYTPLQGWYHCHNFHYTNLRQSREGV